MSSTTSTATPPQHAFEQSVEEIKLSKADLNKVIMEYLTSEGYPLAAQKFALEANMRPTPDLDTIQERVEIREAIHAGDIQTAIEKINELAPQVLDQDESLHFALLRLQLIELIRAGTSSPNGDIAPALAFATTHLAPRAPRNQFFLDDLEQTMALLIFEPGNIAPSLAHQLDPSLRRDVAKRVNEAILESQNQKTKATLFELVNHRAWVQQKAAEVKREGVPEKIDLGFDAMGSGSLGNGEGKESNGSTNSGAVGMTTSHQNGGATGADGEGAGAGGSGGGDAMATE